MAFALLRHYIYNVYIYIYVRGERSTSRVGRKKRFSQGKNILEETPQLRGISIFRAGWSKNFSGASAAWMDIYICIQAYRHMSCTRIIRDRKKRIDCLEKVLYSQSFYFYMYIIFV